MDSKKYIGMDVHKESISIAVDSPIPTRSSLGAELVSPASGGMVARISSRTPLAE